MSIILCNVIVWYGGSPTNSALMKNNSFFSMISCNENEPAVTVHGYWYLLSESDKDRKEKKALVLFGFKIIMPDVEFILSIVE